MGKFLNHFTFLNKNWFLHVLVFRVKYNEDLLNLLNMKYFRILSRQWIHIDGLNTKNMTTGPKVHSEASQTAEMKLFAKIPRRNPYTWKY